MCWRIGPHQSMADAKFSEGVYMKRKVWIIILVFICFIFGGFAYYQYDKNKRIEAFKTAEENTTLSFVDENELILIKGYDSSNGEELILEYDNGLFSSENLIKNYSAETIEIDPKTIDLSKVGENEIHFHIVSHDAYGVEVAKDYTYKVVIQDTQYPTITIKKIWDYFPAGEDVDLREYVDLVFDPVDGELPYSETLKNGTYTIDRSEYLEDAAGTYFLMVCAKDKNGNESYNGFKVTVAGGREQSDEEVDRLAEIFSTYTTFDLDEAIS